MERFWNIIHYCTYKGDYKLHLLFNNINPVVLLLRIPFIKKFYSNKGVDVESNLNTAFKRPDFGLSSMRVGGLMYGLIFFFQLGIIEFFLGITMIKPRGVFFIVTPPFVISIIINNILLFKNDKYLKYFQEFDKMGTSFKRRWSWISFGTIIGIIMFLIIGFIFMDYRV